MPTVLEPVNGDYSKDKTSPEMEVASHFFSDKELKDIRIVKSFAQCHINSKVMMLISHLDILSFKAHTLSNPVYLTSALTGFYLVCQMVSLV